MANDRVAHSYRVEAVRSGDWWSITVPELSGVFSPGETIGSGRTERPRNHCDDAGHRRSEGRLARG